jgi:hypothetical protein
VPATTFRLPEPGSPDISVTPDLLRGPRVAVDGRPIERRRDGPRVYWPVRLAGGVERRLFLAGHLTGLRAIVDGTEYPIERRLAPWEVALSVVPIGLVPLLVGAIGLLTGGLVAGLSFALFRAPWPLVARLGAWAAGVAAAIAVGYAAVVAGLVPGG